MQPVGGSSARHPTTRCSSLVVAEAGWVVGALAGVSTAAFAGGGAGVAHSCAAGTAAPCCAWGWCSAGRLGEGGLQGPADRGRPLARADSGRRESTSLLGLAEAAGAVARTASRMPSSGVEASADTCGHGREAGEGA